MTVDPAVLGEALGARLREIEAAVARYGAFAFAPGGDAPPPPLVEGEATGAARELALRALRVAGDPVNFTLLRRLAQGDASLRDLSDLAGLPRLVLWERVADLVAAGLAARSLEQDLAGLTPAGQTVVELVEEAARSAAGGSARSAAGGSARSAAGGSARSAAEGGAP